MLWGMSWLLMQKTIKNNKKVFLNTLDLEKLSPGKKKGGTYFKRKKISTSATISDPISVPDSGPDSGERFMYILLSFFRKKKIYDCSKNGQFIG